MPIFIFFLLIISCNLNGQTNPEPFDLSSGSYSFTEWDKSNPAGTYPKNMIFHTSKTRDPRINDAMDSDWALAYNLTSRSRVLGLGERGFAFQNTSVQQDTDGAYLGAAVLSLNAKNRSSIHVNWLARTISPAERTYAIVLQYRIGEHGEFTSLPSEYKMTNEPNDEKSMPILILPDVCNNQPIVQLRWKYYYTGIGESGTRPQMGVDDIFVSSIALSSVENAKPIVNEQVRQVGNILYCETSSDCSYSQLKIFNTIGNLLYEKNFKNMIIDLNKFPSGVYFLILSNGNSSQTKKIIVH